MAACKPGSTLGPVISILSEIDFIFFCNKSLKTPSALPNEPTTTNVGLVKL